MQVEQLGLGAAEGMWGGRGVQESSPAAPAQAGPGTCCRGEDFKEQEETEPQAARSGEAGLGEPAGTGRGEGFFRRLFPSSGRGQERGTPQPCAARALLPAVSGGASPGLPWVLAAAR